MNIQEKKWKSVLCLTEHNCEGHKNEFWCHQTINNDVLMMWSCCWIFHLFWWKPETHFTIETENEFFEFFNFKLISECEYNSDSVMNPHVICVMFLSLIIIIIDNESHCISSQKNTKKLSLTPQDTLKKWIINNLFFHNNQPHVCHALWLTTNLI